MENETETKKTDLFATLSQKENPEDKNEKPRDVTVNFRVTLLDLFDKMMNEAGITDPAKLQTLALTRSRIDIMLKDF